MQKIFWKGISHDDRIKAVSEITAVVNNYGAILSFQKFSDIALSLVIEIEESKILRLYTDLKKILIIEGIDNSFNDSPAECIILFEITFTRGTGDLAIEVPDIPE